MAASAPHPLTTTAIRRLSQAETALKRTEDDLEATLSHLARLLHRRTVERDLVAKRQAEVEELQSLDERESE
jgi:hypothetical protein